MTFFDKLSKTLGKSITWAFSGALYGAFFAGMLNFFLIQDSATWMAYMLASLLAGMVISAYFGSMLVALS